jgi:hypothetical protein
MKQQTRWAIVNANGHINHGYMCFTRRDVIASVVANWRNYSFAGKYAHLSDPEFWRAIKRRNGWSARRISLKVAR